MAKRSPSACIEFTTFTDRWGTVGFDDLKVNPTAKTRDVDLQRAVAKIQRRYQRIARRVRLAVQGRKWSAAGVNARHKITKKLDDAVREWLSQHPDCTVPTMAKRLRSEFYVKGEKIKTYQARVRRSMERVG